MCLLYDYMYNIHYTNLAPHGSSSAQAPEVESLDAICARLEREEAEDALPRGITTLLFFSPLNIYIICCIYLTIPAKPYEHLSCP